MEKWTDEQRKWLVEYLRDKIRSLTAAADKLEAVSNCELDYIKEKAAALKYTVFHLQEDEGENA